MMRHIVAATDLSPRSRPALDRGAELASRFGAKLTILHIVEEDQPQEPVTQELREAHTILAEEADRLRRCCGCQVRIAAEAGDPARAIGDVASGLAADMIVLGRHRSRPWRDLFVGTTVERVIWRGTHPVLMVKRPPNGQYKRVAIAIDCSKPSALSLRHAGWLGLLQKARVSVVHACEPFAKTTLAIHAGEEMVQAHVEAELREARMAVMQFLAENHRADLADHVQVDEGAPIAVLEAFLGHHDPDLLVMGTHGRTGLPRVVLGSVADEALRAFDLDMLAIPSRMSLRSGKVREAVA